MSGRPRKPRTNQLTRKVKRAPSTRGREIVPRERRKSSNPRIDTSRFISGLLKPSMRELTKGCNPFFAKAFHYLIALIIVFIVYDVTMQYGLAKSGTVAQAGVAGKKLAEDMAGIPSAAVADVLGVVAGSNVAAVCGFAKHFVGPDSPKRLAQLAHSHTVAPLFTEFDQRLYKIGTQYENVPVLNELVESMRHKLIDAGLKRREGPVDSAGRLPIANSPPKEVLLLDSKPVAAVERSLIRGFASSMRDWVSSLTVTQDISNSVNLCRSFDMELEKIQKNTQVRLRLALDAFEVRLSLIGTEASNMGENVRLALWRVIILYAILNVAASLRRLIFSSRLSGARTSEEFNQILDSEINKALQDHNLEGRGPEFERLNFRMKKSRKRRSVKRKASRKASRKRKSAKRKASRKRRSAKRKSRKRKSAKRKASRKASRKRKSAKRKASRKRKSAKRKASRKRKSAKRKTAKRKSRKRKSAKRKASRKRRSAKRKASRKRRSAKRKASRKRKSAKKKASRKRRSAKRKVSRKRKSAKRKASRKRKRCPPGCVKRR